MALGLALLPACSRDSAVVQLAGGTMGTTWHVTYVDSGHLVREGEILAGIEARLEEVNASMSTYREDSEISRVNTAPVDTWVGVSLPFYTVLSTALEVGRSSGGAYDVTVGPLVNLWGFGPQSGADKVPDPALIATLLQQVGQEKLRLDGEGFRVKKLADLSLDFSSLAKGYAVDQVALWLEEQGIIRYLVEVGGEMRVAGLSGRGDPWRIAIEQPELDAHGVAAALELSDMAIATSGDYRNYFELAGQRYSHSIDPRSGFPVAHELVSVTVVHASAMVADAWATALIVLGPQRAAEVAELQGLAVYFIQRDAGGYVHSQTAGFNQYLPTSG